jgi:PAS domain S-box-containing protein
MANTHLDDVGQLRSRLAALEQLLEVREQVVREQSDRLEQAVAELRQRARQLEQSEHAYRKQTRILQSILDNIADGVVVADEQGQFLLFNPAAERIMGKGLADTPPGQWAGRHGCFLPDTVTPFPPADLPLARAIRGEEVDGVAMFLRHATRPEGAWLDINARPLRDDKGQLRGGVAVVRDVTQHRRAEEALRNSEALYHSLVDNLPISVFRKDLHGRFTFGNQRFCAGLGRPLEQIAGKTDHDFYPPELADKYSQDDRRVMETGAVFEDVEAHQRPDGERLYVQVFKVPIYDFKGAVVGTQGVFWDVTARKRAEDGLQRTARELARSNAELQQFASVVAHDLHEPLRMVASYGRLLQRRCQGRLDGNAAEFLAFMLDGAGRMQELLDDLLEYCRVGAHGRPVQPTSCGGVLHQALANLKIALEESSAAVTQDPLPTVPGDGPQLVQLFQNLIANAVKFRAAAPPRVHVAARRQGAAWLFSVRDNGIGIDPQQAGRLFVIFQRLHTRQEYPGTGIGLAICKKIVERHHGRIWVESQPGQGSVFYFTLPAT